MTCRAGVADPAGRGLADSARGTCGAVSIRVRIRSAPRAHRGPGQNRARTLPGRSTCPPGPRRRCRCRPGRGGSLVDEASSDAHRFSGSPWFSRQGATQSAVLMMIGLPMARCAVAYGWHFVVYRRAGNRLRMRAADFSTVSNRPLPCGAASARLPTNEGGCRRVSMPMTNPMPPADSNTGAEVMLLATSRLHEMTWRLIRCWRSSIRLSASAIWAFKGTGSSAGPFPASITADPNRAAQSPTPQRCGWCLPSADSGSSGESQGKETER